MYECSEIAGSPQAPPPPAADYVGSEAGSGGPAASVNTFLQLFSFFSQLLFFHPALQPSRMKINGLAGKGSHKTQERLPSTKSYVIYKLININQINI
jgi:hypothetical protein